MDIFFWCSLTSVIVLSPSTNLKVGLRILSMSPCVLRCEILWWQLDAYHGLGSEGSLPAWWDTAIRHRVLCFHGMHPLWLKNARSHHFESLKWFDTTDRKKALRCFSVLDPFFAMWILFWVFANGEEIHWCRAEWQGAWMGSRSREPRLAGTCQGLEAMELIERGTQNWRNKALQDEDTPSCQEGGWNDVFLLGAFRGWLWHGVRLGFRQGGIVSWVLGRRDRPMDKFASEVGGWEDREIEGVGIVWHMLPASRQWWRRWTSATDVGWVRIN